MKAQDIKIGKVYIAKVSGQLANVRVQRMEEACDGRHRWVCENLETGRKVVVRGAARFRREAVPVLSEEGRQRAERGIEVAAQLRQRREDGIQATVNLLVRDFGSALVERTDYLDILFKHGLRSDQVTSDVIDRANQYVRQHLVEQFRQVVAPAHADNITDRVDTNNERTKSMHIAESDARSLLKALGNKNADTLTVPELEHRLNQPKKLAKHLVGKVLEEADLNNLRNIADATNEGEKVVVVAETGEQEEAVKESEPEETQPEEQPVKAHANGRVKAGKKTKPNKTHETKDGVVKKNKAKGSKMVVQRGPKVVDFVIQRLGKANKTHPITKDEMHKELVKHFPERKPESLRNYVQFLIPFALKRDHELEVEGDKEGYYLLAKSK